MSFKTKMEKPMKDMNMKMMPKDPKKAMSGMKSGCK